MSKSGKSNRRYHPYNRTEGSNETTMAQDNPWGDSKNPEAKSTTPGDLSTDTGYNESKADVTKLTSIEKSKCPICLDSELHTEMLGLPCSHTFHKVCITHWLKRKRSCPVCRFSLRSILNSERNSSHRRSTNGINDDVSDDDDDYSEDDELGTEELDYLSDEAILFVPSDLTVDNESDDEELDDLFSEELGSESAEEDVLRSVSAEDDVLESESSEDNESMFDGMSDVSDRESLSEGSIEELLDEMSSDMSDEEEMEVEIDFEERWFDAKDQVEWYEK